MDSKIGNTFMLASTEFIGPESKIGLIGESARSYMMASTEFIGPDSESQQSLVHEFRILAANWEHTL
jgi:hypothetical protein